MLRLPSNLRQPAKGLTALVSLSAFALAGILANAGQAAGNTYYVSPSGNDASLGSSAAPFRQIRRAMQVARAGDTVLVADGSYLGFTLSGVNGAEGSPITVKATGSQALITLTTDRGDNRDTILVTGCSNIALEGLKAFNATRSGIRVSESSRIAVRNCTFGNGRVWGIFTDFADDLVLEGNECYGSVEQHGIYVSNSGDRPVLRANRCYNNGGCGIQLNADVNMGGDGIISDALIENNTLYGNGARGGAAINLDGVQDSLVRNNLLYGNLAGGIVAYQFDGAQGPKGVDIVHNTVVMPASARWPMQFGACVGMNTLKNNIFVHGSSWKGGVAFEYGSDVAQVDTDFNVMTAANGFTLAQWQAMGHDLNSLPATAAELFVNPANNDYHLLGTAPALDRAPILWNVPVDREGRARPQGLANDMGSYERSSSQVDTNPPPTPTNLTAGQSFRQINVTWTGSARASSYSVYRSGAASGPFTKIASGVVRSTYTDATVTPGVTYYYAVTGVNAAGESGQSNVASASAVDQLRIDAGGPSMTDPSGNIWLADSFFAGGSIYTVPTAPITGTTVPALYRTVRFGGMTYSFPAPSGSYTLKLHFAETFFTTAGKRVFNVAINGTPVLSNLDLVKSAGANVAVVKTFTVEPVNGNVNVAFTGVVENPIVSAIEMLSSSGTPTPTVPAAPAALAAVAGNAKVDLTWNAASGAASYTVKRSTTAGGPYTTVSGALTGTSFSDNLVTNGTTYYYVVTAANTAGESGASNEASAKPVAPAVSALRVNAGGSTFVGLGGVTWGADQYFSGGQSWSTGGTISGATDPMLYQSVRYGAMSYRLPATDGSYTLKLHFAEVYHTATGRRVFNVSVNGQAVENRLDVVSAAGGAFKALVKSYSVQASGGVVTVSFTNVADNALVCGIELIPQGGGTGPTTPAAPTGLSASAGNAKADLSWTASTGAVSYSVKRATAAGGAYTTVASGLTATSYADSGLTNGTTYYYVVTATNTAGESGASNEASAKPVAPAVSALRIRCGGGALTAPDGTVWGADQYFTGGQPWSTSAGISGTTTPALYQALRYGAMTYQLPASDGAYTLKLHFAETYFSTTGRRTFNVAVNGQAVASNLDVASAAGGAFKALVKSYTVQATGGRVTVTFSNVVDNAVISGIELVPVP